MFIYLKVSVRSVFLLHLLICIFFLLSLSFGFLSSLFCCDFTSFLCWKWKLSFYFLLFRYEYVLEEVTRRTGLPQAPRAGPSNPRLLTPSWSLECVTHLPRPRQSHFEDLSLQKAMCCWDYMEGVHNWTPLRPLCKQLRFWWPVWETSLLSKSPCFLNPPPAMEWPACVFWSPVPLPWWEVCVLGVGDKFQTSPRELLRVWTNPI